MASETFSFAFDSRFRHVLAGLGITPSSASVTVTDEELDARFGPWRLRTPIQNITDVQVSGNYQWFKVIGPRGSLADRGVTFGTNTDSGACVLFREPVKALDPTGTILHPGATFTVSDPEDFAEAVRSRIS